jgi:hypothetical protein
VTGPFFILVFMMIFIYVHTNIFIAILEEAYSAFREEQGDDSEQYNMFTSILLFLISK